MVFRQIVDKFFKIVKDSTPFSRGFPREKGVFYPFLPGFTPGERGTNFERVKNKNKT